MSAPRRPTPRILRVVSRMSIGGVQRGLLATLSRADRTRFDYHVLCYKKAGMWADRVAELGVPLHVQRTIPPWHPFKIMMLARMIRQIAPDLVHIQMAPTVIPAATAARLAGVRKLVIQHHNDYARHWESLNPLLRNWEYKLTRGADAVMAVSEAVARCTEEHVGLPQGSVRVVPNGLELDRFTNATPRDPRPEWGLAPDTPLVAHVARYLPTKRIEDFIEAGAIILKRWSVNQPRPVFAVIGGGDSVCERAYRELIDKLGVASNILLVGKRDDVPEILPTVQVAALASEMEGFGQVILEYIASGAPVASTNLPCIAEMVQGGRDVLFSPPRNPQLLADNIEKLLLDRNLARTLIQNGRNRLAIYDWSNAIKSYESLYDEILSR